jgi:hypothetical protein
MVKGAAKPASMRVKIRALSKLKTAALGKKPDHMKMSRLTRVRTRNIPFPQRIDTQMISDRRHDPPSAIHGDEP